MNKLGLAAIGLASFGFASTAQAAATLVSGNNQLDAMVHLDPAHDSTDVLTVFGLAKPTEAGVTFTATTLIDGTGGNGYAQISDADMPGGTADFVRLLIDLVDPLLSFNAYEFSVQGEGDGLLAIQYSLAGTTCGINDVGCWITVGGSPVAIGTGNKDFLLFGDNFNQVRLTATGTTISQVKQNDINVTTSTAPVPEPATWGMFILGFAAVGYSLRRRRRYQLTQVV